MKLRISNTAIKKIAETAKIHDFLNEYKNEQLSLC